MLPRHINTCRDSMTFQKNSIPHNKGKNHHLVGKHQPEETRIKISETLKKNNIGFRKGYTPWNKGKPSPFRDKNIHTPETRKKISEIQKGKHHSSKTEFKKGIIPWMKGRCHTEDAKRKNREAHLGQKLPEH